jgi:thioredoxin reductase
MAQNHPSIKVSLIHSRDRLLSNEPLSDEFMAQTAEMLQEEGVVVILNQRPSITTDGQGNQILRFKDGTETQPGFIFDATSKWVPITAYLPAAALDDEGYVKVQAKFASRP